MRAAVSLKPYTGADRRASIKNLIVDERRRVLFVEGSRNYDIQRFNLPLSPGDGQRRIRASAARTATRRACRCPTSNASTTRTQPERPIVTDRCDFTKRTLVALACARIVAGSRGAARRRTRARRHDVRRRHSQRPRARRPGQSVDSRRRRDSRRQVREDRQACTGRGRDGDRRDGEVREPRLDRHDGPVGRRAAAQRPAPRTSCRRA